MPARTLRVALLLTTFGVACQDGDDDGWGFQTDDSEPQIAPVVTLNAPLDGSSYAWGAGIPISGEVQSDSAPDEISLTLVSSLLGELPVGLRVAEDGSFGASLALTEGQHLLTVTAIDPSGAQGSASVTVTQLANQAPSEPRISLTPQAPTRGEPLFAGLTQVGEDPEGRPVDHLFWWTVDGEAAPEWDGITLIPEGVTHKDEQWAVHVVATDGELQSDEVSLSVTILGTGPVITVEIDPESPSRNDTLRCNYTVEEPDGAVITAQSARWLLNDVDAGDADSPFGGALSRGDEVSCEVSATSSATATAEDKVTIVNLVPVVDSVSIGGTPAQEGSTLSCGASASDGDGDSLSLDLSWSVDGVTVSTAETLDGASFDKGQSVICEVRAWDGADWSATAQSAAVLVENSPPSAPGVALSPSSAPVWVTLSCQELSPGLDADPADSLSTLTEWSVNGASVSSGSDSFATWGLAAGDLVTCERSVDDGSAQASAQASLTLGARLGTLTAGSADLSLDGGNNRGAFGAALLAVDDLDADGLGELLVAASGYNSSTGAVYLFTGATLLAGAGADTDADAWWTGDTSADALGDLQGLASTPDIDGDGVAELLLAAPSGNVSAVENGGVWLMLSGERSTWGQGNTVSSDAALVLRGSAEKDRLGSGLAGADLDGDGVGDLIVGVPYEDSAASNAGSVAVFLMGGAMPSSLTDNDADYTLLADATLDHLGLNGVENLGDLDGDGYPELMLGAPDMDSSTGTDAGVALLISAGSLASGKASSLAYARLEGLAKDDDFGISGVGLGDLDGDGQGDLAVGARFGDVVGTDAGAVYFWFGGGSGVLSASTADASWGSGATNDRLGWELSVGDIDADGVLDLCTGAYTMPVSSRTETGQAWLLPGAGYTDWSSGGLISAQATASVPGSATRSYLGRMPAILGDLDGDGYGEWAVGAQGQNQGSLTRAGAVYIWYGP